jgi:hypothetical protein
MKDQTLPLLFVLMTTLASWSCQSGKPNEAASGDVAATDTAAVIDPGYPALGNQDISTLYAQADKVDIIFYHLPISVNQEDPSSVKNTVLYVTPASPKITAKCQPIGRLSWMSQGNIIREADIYCDTGCEYLLFIQDNKPFAANAMHQAGVDFFKNVISQVEKTRQ